VNTFQNNIRKFLRQQYQNDNNSSNNNSGNNNDESTATALMKICHFNANVSTIFLPLPAL
jgi:hypothetical protein